MQYIKEIEMEKFRDDFEIGLDETKSNNYLDEDDYEDEFSHNEIHKAQYQLKKDIESHLSNHGVGGYKVYCDWCVHVIKQSLYDDAINRFWSFGQTK